MAAPLRTGAQFQDLAQDTAFLNAPQNEQVLYLMQDYLPRQDAEFAKAPKAEQQQYVQEVVMPQLQVLKANGGALQPEPIDAPQINVPNWNDYDPNSPVNIGKDLLGATLSTGAGALKGLSLGYLDATKPVEDFARNTIGAKYYSPGIAAGGGELAGALPVFEGIGGAIKGGAEAVGRAALPLSTRMAQAAGVGSRFHRAALNAATWIQSGGLLPTAARVGTEMGLYEGLKSHPQQPVTMADLITGKARPQRTAWEEIQLRAEDALKGAATGAAFGVAAPLLGRVAMNVIDKGRAVPAGVRSAVREIPYLLDEIRSTAKPVGLGRMPARQVSKRVQDANLKLRTTVRDLYEGKLDNSRLTEADVKALGQSMDDLERVIQGEAGLDAKAVANKARAVVGRVTLKAKAAAKVKAKAAAKVKPKDVKIGKPNQTQSDPKGLAEPAPEVQKPVEAKAPVEAKIEYQDVEKTVTRKVKKYTPEVQAKIDRIDAEHKAYAARRRANNAISPSDKEKDIKGSAMRAAAEKRRIIQGDSLEPVDGGLTGIELSAAIKKEQSNYVGKPVIVNGKSGKVKTTAFGKVVVTLEDGSTVTVEPKLIKPKPRPTPKPTIIEAEVTETVIERVPVTPKATEPPKPPEQAKLTGSISEMVDQGLKAFGGTIDDAKRLIAKVATLGKAEDDEILKTLTAERKALGSKRDEATLKAKAEIDAKIAERKAERKDMRDKAGTLHPNLRETLSTGWDGKSAVAEQLAVDTEKQLTAKAVAEHVTDPAERKVLDQLGEAAERGVSVRLEHQAEVTGSTDAAAKVTGAGNVKVPVSTFTPTHFRTVQKGDKTLVAAMGYNEAGYQHLYYITKSPEGSQILKVQKILETEQHVGATPNVYLGARKYKVADVLGRKPENEGILTSQALENAKAFAKLFTAETVKQFSPATQKMIRTVQKQGRFDEYTMRQLFKAAGRDKKDLGKLCDIFGLTYAK